MANFFAVLREKMNELRGDLNPYFKALTYSESENPAVPYRALDVNVVNDVEVDTDDMEGILTDGTQATMIVDGGTSGASVDDEGDIGVKVNQLPQTAIKAAYDESDIAENKITIAESLGEMTGLIARNNSTSNTVTFTIGGIPIVLATKGVDANNIPNDYKFYGTFEAFDEITVAGTSPDFDIFVEG